MSRYTKQLEEEVKRAYSNHHDSFHLQGDKAKLTPSYGSLYHALGQDQDPNDDDTSTDAYTDADAAWHDAVKEYKHMGSSGSRRSEDESLKHGHESSPTLNHGNKISGSSTCTPTSNSNGNGNGKGVRLKRKQRAPIKFHRKKSQTADIFLQFAIVFVALYTILILIGPWILLTTMDKSTWCPIYDGNTTETTSTSTAQYENPDYIRDECYLIRLPHLFYLTLEEADLCTRMLMSVLMGGAIGYERRSADRPAGVRTMGLVSLGSCFFTISSQLAFKSSTMGWDASRVTAAIPSGCGFLGAGLIWKGQVHDGDNKQTHHEIHGLTTAAGVWLSAAIGVGCGGKMYFVSAYSMVLVTVILRYGPKIYLCFDCGAGAGIGGEYYYEEEQEREQLEEELYRKVKRKHASSTQIMTRENKLESHHDMSRRPSSTTPMRVPDHSMKDVHIHQVKETEQSNDQIADIRTCYRSQNRGCANHDERNRNESNGIVVDDDDDDDLSCSETSLELSHLPSK